MLETRDAALAVPRTLVGREDAELHEGQFEAIEAVVGKRQRLLVVQRTGWGKSAVYFVATLLLRKRGAGPTILVSPLHPESEYASRLGGLPKALVRGLPRGAQHY